MVEQCLEEAPFEKFFGDIVMGNAAPSIGLICAAPTVYDALFTSLIITLITIIKPND